MELNVWVGQIFPVMVFIGSPMTILHLQEKKTVFRCLAEGDLLLLIADNCDVSAVHEISVQNHSFCLPAERRNVTIECVIFYSFFHTTQQNKALRVWRGLK